MNLLRYFRSFQLNGISVYGSILQANRSNTRSFSFICRNNFEYIDEENGSEVFPRFYNLRRFQSRMYFLNKEQKKRFDRAFGENESPYFILFMFSICFAVTLYINSKHFLKKFLSIVLRRVKKMKGIEITYEGVTGCLFCKGISLLGVRIKTINNNINNDIKENEYEFYINTVLLNISLKNLMSVFLFKSDTLVIPFVYFDSIKGFFIQKEKTENENLIETEKKSRKVVFDVCGLRNLDIVLKKENGKEMNIRFADLQAIDPIEISEPLVMTLLYQLFFRARFKGSVGTHYQISNEKTRFTRKSKDYVHHSIFFSLPMSEFSFFLNFPLDVGSKTVFSHVSCSLDIQEMKDQKMTMIWKIHLKENKNMKILKKLGIIESDDISVERKVEVNQEEIENMKKDKDILVDYIIHEVLNVIIEFLENEKVRTMNTLKDKVKKFGNF